MRCEFRKIEEIKIVILKMMKRFFKSVEISNNEWALDFGITAHLKRDIAFIILRVNICKQKIRDIRLIKHNCGVYYNSQET